MTAKENLMKGVGVAYTPGVRQAVALQSQRDDQFLADQQTYASFNPVSKPAHYNHGEGIECIDYIRQVLGKEGFVAYCRGNVIKYNHRAMYKGNPTEDLSKAAQYLEWANETLKEIHK